MTKSIADKHMRTPSPLTAREFFIRTVPGGVDHELCSVVRKETSVLTNVIRVWCSCDTMLSVPRNDMNETILQNVPEGKLGKLVVAKGGK